MLYVRKLFTQDLRDGKQIAFPKEPSLSFFVFDYISKEDDRKISFTFKAAFDEFSEYDGKVITTRLYAAGSEARMDGEVKAFIRDELNAKVDDLLIFKSKGTKHTDFEVMFLPQSNSYYPMLLALTNGDNHSVCCFYDNNLNDLKKTSPLQRIFYGAPGTGKSFSIKSEIAKHQGIGVEKVDMEADNIFRTTFHPDYDYAQFVGCYKPTKEDSEKLTIDYKFLLDKLSEFTNNYNQTTSAFLLGLEYRSELDRVLQAEHKTYNDLFKDAGCQSTNLPTMLTAGITANDRNRVLKSQITYSFTPQVFTNALVKAYENPTENVYLVIEEINRGNCAQIFGDIFQLLDRNGNGESEYTINVDEDLKKYLEENCPAAINDGKIKLPSNFNIIATMNTSDQSLFPMDSAFKRRWEWEYVPVKYGTDVDSSKFKITIGEKTYNWHTFLEAVNAKIKDVTSSEDKQMGNFFIKGDVDAKAFCNKVMFYLWNDVSKDYYESNDSLFQYIEEDSKPAKHFSFNELFGENQTKLLHGFMKFVKCNPIPKKESDGSDSVQSASEDSNNSQEA